MHHRAARRRGPVAAAAAACVIAVQVFVLAPAASAGVVCSALNHIATVTVSGPGAFIVRVSSNGSDLLVNMAACGKVGPLGDPSAIDHVNIGGDPAAFGQVIIDVSGGPLGPGFTDENNGSSEIEMDITGGTTSVTVFGSTGNDDIIAGAHRVFNGGEFTFESDFNLNGFADGQTYDADVFIHDFPSLLGLFGDAGNDVLSGVGGPGLLQFPAVRPIRFNDGPGADSMIGGSNDDEFRSTDVDSPDSFQGSAGFDVLRYDDRFQDMHITQDGVANDGVGCTGGPCEGDNVGSDIEQILGGSGNDTIVGGPGPQLISGFGGTNVIKGGPGDDVLDAGFGVDDFSGGKGVDLVSYFGHGPVDVSLDGKRNDGFSGENDFVHNDIEGVIGSSSDDHITGSARADRLFGGTGDDVIHGLGGNDFMDGGGLPPRLLPEPADGSDVFFGGPGVDTVTEAGHTAGVTVTFDNLPNDVVSGQPGEGSDNIRTDVENVIGTDFGDHIVGSPAANRFVGGAGNDTLNGAEGNDVLLPGPGVDHVVGGPGLDTASFAGAAAAVTASLADGTATGDGDDTLAGLERLVGTSLADRLGGSTGANVLTGGGGDDVLKGLAGDDKLSGGPGDDTLNGGPGSDTCVQGPGTGPKNSCEH